MLVGTIDIINDMICTWIFGVPQSCQAYEWLEEVVNHIVLVE